jgi:hypothetical protein
LIKPVKQPGGPDRAVTPSEVVKVFSIRLIVKDQANIAVCVGDL